ncbi:MAG: carboxypeptidase-like regulatory domain-containing protein, partial [Bacteroidota bacterium]
MKTSHFIRLVTTLLSLCFIVKIGFTQSDKKQFFQGQIIDQKSRLPISYANIYNQTTGNGTISDVEGKFKIAVEQLPNTLEISFIGYKTKQIQVEETKVNQVIIELSKSSIALPEITVSATPKIEAISEEKFSVKDYLPFNDKLLILKNYDSFQKDILSLTDTEGEEISQLSLKDINGVEALYQGCLGGLYVITSTDAHEISFDANGDLQLSRTIDAKKVENLLLPCIEASPTHVYFQDYLHEGQMVILSAAKRSERGNFVIRRIADQQNIRLLYTQVRPRSGDVNDATIEDKDILKYLRGLQHDYANTMHLFYQPLY